MTGRVMPESVGTGDPVTEGSHSVLLSEFGPTSKTAPAQAAAYPFTRLRSDGLWTLDRDVPMARVGPLNSEPITGQLTPAVERALAEPGVLNATARAVVDAEFPLTHRRRAHCGRAGSGRGL